MCHRNPQGDGTGMGFGSYEEYDPEIFTPIILGIAAALAVLLMGRGCAYILANE